MSCCIDTVKVSLTESAGASGQEGIEGYGVGALFELVGDVGRGVGDAVVHHPEVFVTGERGELGAGLVASDAALVDKAGGIATGVQWLHGECRQGVASASIGGEVETAHLVGELV